MTLAEDVVTVMPSMKCLQWSNVRLRSSISKQLQKQQYQQHNDESIYRIEHVAEILPSPVNVDTATDDDNQCTMSSSLSSLTPPTMIAAACNDGFAIGVDTQVHLFEASLAELLVTVNLDSVVECLSWSPDSRFLVVADNSGTLHFLHVPTRRVLFSQHIVMEPSSTKPSTVFVDLSFVFHSIDDVELLVATAAGVLYRFCKVRLKSLHDAIVCGDRTNAMSIQAAIRRHKIVLSIDAHSNTNTYSTTTVVSAVGFGVSSRLPIAFVGGKGRYPITVWELSGSGDPPKMLAYIDDRILGRGVTVVRLAYLSHCGWLIVLDSLGILSLWDANTLVCLRRFNNETTRKYADFRIIKSTFLTKGSRDQRSDLKVAVLAEDCMQILSFPKFSILLDVKVSNNASLATVTDGDSLNAALIGEFLSSSGDNNVMSSVNISVIAESLPVNCFHYLLHQGRFDAAIEFAQTHGLDVQLVHREHALALLDRGCCDADGLPAVRACLDKLDDACNVIEFCVNALPSSISATKDLLSYGFERMEALSPDKRVRLDSIAMTNSLRRLDTFRLAFGDQNFTSFAWQEFRTVNFIEAICTNFANGLTHAAMTIWRHHVADDDHDVMGSLKLILSSIPVETPLSRYEPWLREDVMPRLGSEGSSKQLGVFLDWLLKRALSFESIDSTAWPGNALLLLSVINAESSSSISSIYTPSEAAGRSILVHSTVHQKLPVSVSNNGNDDDDKRLTQLRELRVSLLEIEYLFTVHNFRIPYDDFKRETPESIAFQLLDAVLAVELLKQVVETRIRPYLRRCALDEDRTLLSYAVDTMEATKGFSAVAADSPWDLRVISIIHCIKSIDTMVEAVLELMRCSPVPWSEAAGELFTMALECPHHLHDEVVEQFRLMELRKTLLRYGAQHFNASDTSLARGVMRRILVQNPTPDGLDDALQVVAAYHHLSSSEAHTVYLMNICSAYLFSSEVENTTFATSSDTCSNIKTVLRHLTDVLSYPDVLIVGQEIVQWLSDIVGDPIMLPSDTRARQRALDLAVEILHIVVPMASLHSLDRPVSPTIYIATQEILSSMTAMSVLLREFDLYVSIDCMNDENGRWEVFLRYVGLDTLTAIPSSTTTVPPISKLQRVAKLLLIPRRKVMLLLSRISISKSHFNEAIMLSYDDTSGVIATSTSWSMLQSSAALVDSDSNCESSSIATTEWNSVHDSLATALITCSSARLTDVLSLHACISTIVAILSHCDLAEDDKTDGSNPTTTTAIKSDIAKAYPCSMSMFRESGFVMSATVAVPLAAAMSVARFPNGLSAFVVESYNLPLPYQSHSLETLSPCSIVVDAFESDLECGKSDVPYPAIIVALSACHRLATHLKSNSLCLFAMRQAIITMGVCLQHIALDDAIFLTVTIDDAATRSILNTQDTQVYVKQLESLITALAGKALRSKCVDHALVAGLLGGMHAKAALNAIRSHLSPLLVAGNFDRLAIVATVGENCAILWRQEAICNDFQRMRRDMRWKNCFRRLGKDDFDAQLMSSGDPSYFKQAIVELMKRTWKHSMLPSMSLHNYNFAPKAPLEAGLEFCNAYGLTYDMSTFVHCSYIEMMVSSGNGVHKTLSRDAMHQLELLLSDSLLKIPSYSERLRLLEDECISRISCYDYERLRVVFNCALATVGKCTASTECNNHNKSTLFEKEATYIHSSIALLDILQRYRRHSEPGMEEMAIDSSNDTNEAHLSALSCERLPFHQLSQCNPWPVLARELTVDCVYKLLPVADVLGLSRDQFCSIAIENTCQRVTSDPGTSAPPFNFFEPVLARISAPDLATMSGKLVSDCYSVRDECNFDDNRVLALKSVVSSAEKWSRTETSDASSKAHRTVKAMTALLVRAEAGRLLISEGLGEKMFLEVVDRPSELICQLYLRYAMPTDEDLCTRNIHMVVDVLCKRFSLDVEKIRRHLVQKWLLDEHASDFPGNKDSCKDDVIGRVGSLNLAGSALGRVISLLNYGDIDRHIKFLLSFAYQQQAPKITWRSRARAVWATFAIGTPARITAIYGKSMAELRRYLQNILYMVEFDALQMPLLLSDFESVNQQGVVRGLLRDYNESPVAITVATNLCIDYQIHDANLWIRVIDTLKCVLPLSAILAKALMYASSVAALHNLPCLRDTWTSLLTDLVSSEGSSKLMKGRLSRDDVTSLLLRCPFVAQLKIRSLIEKLIATKHMNLALDCSMITLMLTDCDNDGDAILHSLINAGLVESLLANIDTHLNRNSNIGRDLRRRIFEMIESDTNHLDVLLASGSDPPSGFISHLVQVRRINNLFISTLRAGRFDDAMKLIQLYKNQSGEELIMITNDGQSRVLRDFMQQEGLLNEHEELLPGKYM